MKLFFAGTSSLIILGCALVCGMARAEIRPDRIHTADAKKTEAYVRDGLIIGGDKAINEVVVKDIRRAANPGYERVVVDLEGNRDGEPVAVQRPPYYQVSVNAEEKRLIFTVWGSPKLAFDPRKVVGAFKKSAVVQNVRLLPLLEDDSWTFVFELKGARPVEIFELSNPVRIIVDIRSK